MQRCFRARSFDRCARVFGVARAFVFAGFDFFRGFWCGAAPGRFDFGSPATTSSYDARINDSSSRRSSTDAELAFLDPHRASKIRRRDDSLALDELGERVRRALERHLIRRIRG